MLRAVEVVSTVGTTVDRGIARVELYVGGTSVSNISPGVRSCVIHRDRETLRRTSCSMMACLFRTIVASPCCSVLEETRTLILCPTASFNADIRGCAVVDSDSVAAAIAQANAVRDLPVVSVGIKESCVAPARGTVVGVWAVTCPTRSVTFHAIEATGAGVVVSRKTGKGAVIVVVVTVELPFFETGYAFMFAS